MLVSRTQLRAILSSSRSRNISVSSESFEGDFYEAQEVDCFLGVDEIADVGSMMLIKG